MSRTRMIVLNLDKAPDMAAEAAAGLKNGPPHRLGGEAGVL